MRLYEFFTNLYEISDAVKKRMREKFKQADQNLTDAQVNYYLDRWDRYSNNFPPDKKDITRLSFREVEQLIKDAEAHAGIRGKGKVKDEVDEVDDTPIYNKNGIVIYKGDSKSKCIKYGKGYEWCISRPSGNQFNSYRYGVDSRIFYFVFDKSLPTDDPWHAIVVHVLDNGKLKVTTTSNDDDYDITWESLVNTKPKLKSLRHLFDTSPVNKKEKEEYNRLLYASHNDGFIELTFSDKVKYIESGFDLTPKEQDLLDNKLLSLYIKNSFLLSNKTWLRISNSDFKYVINRVNNMMSFPDLAIFANLPERKSLVLNRMKSIIDSCSASDINHYITRRLTKSDEILETMIIDKPLPAGTYAGTLLKTRWPEAETYIKTDPATAVGYTMQFFPKGWPEAEPYIKKSPYSAVMYATQVLGNRWPEAEPYIKEDPEIWLWYKRELYSKW